MKREIVCTDCAGKLHALLLPPVPGEGVEFVAGEAKGAYVCDNCGKDMLRGEKVEALSIYTDDIPYSPWESTYITRIEKR